MSRPTKDAIRRRVWRRLTEARVARFPFPTVGRIPNFTGAEAAAARAAMLPEWKRARRLKCNPDAPQRPVRLRALKDGKVVFMAVPRLTQERCFIRLDPRRLGGRLAEASSIGGALRLGEPVLPKDVGAIDLVVVGSVAVHASGARVGKGGGYSDLEWALARELGLLTARTRVLSTVHDRQVLRAAIPMTGHDVPVDLIVTPTRTLRTKSRRAKPRAIRWDELDAARIAAMPPIARLAR